MTASSSSTPLLDRFASAGVEFRLLGGKLQRRPRYIGEHLAQLIAEHREELIAELHQAQARRVLASGRRSRPVVTPTLATPAPNPSVGRLPHGTERGGPSAQGPDQAPAGSETDDAELPWWERPGFALGEWIARAEQHVSFEQLEGGIVVRARRPYTPPWVLSDAHQLLTFDVLTADTLARHRAASTARSADGDLAGSTLAPRSPRQPAATGDTGAATEHA